MDVNTFFMSFEHHSKNTKKSSKCPGGDHAFTMFKLACAEHPDRHENHAVNAFGDADHQKAEMCHSKHAMSDVRQQCDR